MPLSVSQADGNTHPQVLSHPTPGDFNHGSSSSCLCTGTRSSQGGERRSRVRHHGLLCEKRCTHGRAVQANTRRINHDTKALFKKNRAFGSGNKEELKTTQRKLTEVNKNYRRKMQAAQHGPGIHAAASEQCPSVDLHTMDPGLSQHLSTICEDVSRVWLSATKGGGQGAALD